MVTRQQYEALLAQRSKLKPTLELTPDNTLFAHIGAKQDRQREDDIAAIERAFHDARRDMRRERELSIQHGRPRAAFNHTPGAKP